VVMVKQLALQDIGSRARLANAWCVGVGRETMSPTVVGTAGDRVPVETS
jgi:hypothetical protein